MKGGVYRMLTAKQTYTTKHDEMIYLTMIIHVAV